MKRLIYGSFFLICMALVGSSKYNYIQTQHDNAKNVFALLQSQIQGNPMAESNQEIIKATLTKYPDSVYMLLQDPSTQSGWGYVNVVSFEHGAYPIEQKLHADGTVPTFDWMTQMQAKSKFVEASVFQWPEQTLNMYYGYLSPTHRFDWNIRQQIALVGFYVWLVLGSLLSFLYFFSPSKAWPKVRVARVTNDETNSTESQEKEIMAEIQAKAEKQAQMKNDFSEPKNAAPSAPQPSVAVEPIEVIEFPVSDQVDPPVDSTSEKLEEYQEQIDPIVAMLSDDEHEDDTFIDDIPKQVWVRLLDEPNIHGWESKGSLYARETKKGIQAVLFPWGSSMVTRKETIFPTYLYEVEGRVMSGEEGFVVLFQIGEFYLTWVLGGWKNTRCEVVGYESTKTTHTIEPKKWHHVRIEKDKNEVIGYIDGRTAWQLPLTDITESSPDLGFMNGVGIGVWSTSVKFRNIRILKI